MKARGFKFMIFAALRAQATDKAEAQFHAKVSLKIGTLHARGQAVTKRIAPERCW